MRLPSSRASFGGRLSWFDLAWITAAPFIAFGMRSPEALTSDWLGAPWLFVNCAIVLSLVSLYVFRIRDGLSGFFSVHDALEIAKAGLFVAALTCMALFTLTRLDGVARSLPLIHAAVLVSGLLVARLIPYLATSRRPRRRPSSRSCQYAIIVGVNRLTSLYLSFLGGSAPDGLRVIGLLDERNDLVGRRVRGVPIVGSPSELDKVVDEFAVHGVDVDRVIIVGQACQIGTRHYEELRTACEGRSITLASLPDISDLFPALSDQPLVIDSAPAVGRVYAVVKRLIDITAAAILLIILMPVLAYVGILVLFSIGSPVLFWQQRLGAGGRPFHLYKFRTIRAPYDAQGRPISVERRLSTLGRWLRTLHVDELPQLYNVLIGDMSLIGPRPLLQIDQPADPAVRLSVRPGITGWAQINGGKLLTPAEKDALDRWYVRNASLRVDLDIVLKTARSLLQRSGGGEFWERDASSRRPLHDVLEDVSPRPRS